MPTPKPQRHDVYTHVTQQIVAAIEAGAGPWRTPWHHDGGGTTRPTNVASSRGYRGVNRLALWVAATTAGYSTGTWGTYRQWVRRESRMRGVISMT